MYRFLHVLNESIDLVNPVPNILGVFSELEMKLHEAETEKFNIKQMKDLFEQKAAQLATEIVGKGIVNLKSDQIVETVFVFVFNFLYVLISTLADCVMIMCVQSQTSSHGMMRKRA